MFPSFKISVRWSPALLGLLVWVAAPASAAGTPHSTAARASAAVRSATVSRALQRSTGLSAAQLGTRAVCGSAPAPRIRCYAQLLTVKSSGRTASPRQAPHAHAAASAGAASAPAASAPAAYTAGFLQSAYDTTWLSANRGAGDTVAIVDAYGDPGAYSDMEQFRSANGLQQIPSCSSSVTTSCFEVVNQRGQTNSLPSSANDETGSWNIEESLDLDAVSSICPLCKIVMVEANSDDYYGSPDLETAVSTAARLGADQISLSWGGHGAPDAAANESPYSSITSAAVLAAAGDGSYPGPEVGYPAALAGVTAVGGTSLTADASAARGYDESTWSVETCGGGSTCATESGCDTSQSIPSYQSGVTTGCAGRAYNDISADADPNTGLEIYDSQSGSEGCGTTNNWCIIGGTSLATPLTAALEGVTGVASAITPAWTYSDASQLNDVVSGSDGSCPPGWYLICNAATGWDGPTGNGSISGDLATGGPGLGGTTASGTNATDVTLTGGLYPNGESTSYDWQYWLSGQSASSGTSTNSALTSASTLQTAATTICGTLSPATTYDYELVATNASASVAGDQGSFTTAAHESAPTSSSAPAISGSAVAGQSLTGTNGGWADASCNSAPSYAWQESASSGGPWTTVGSGQSYVLAAADLGQYVRFTASESNGGVSTTVPSAVIGPVTEPPAGTTPTTTTPTSTTSTPTTTSPTPTSSTTTTTVRFYRCAHTCTPLNTHGAGTYRPRAADDGHYIKVVTTVSRVVGDIRTDTTSTRWVGPITSTSGGDVTVGAGARIASATVVRGSSGKALAQVRVTRHSATKLTLLVRREAPVPTQVWAFVLSGDQVLSGTRAHSLGHPVTLSFALKRGQTIKLVAVRT